MNSPQTVPIRGEPSYNNRVSQRRTTMDPRPETCPTRPRRAGRKALPALAFLAAILPAAAGAQQSLDGSTPIPPADIPNVDSVPVVPFQDPLDPDAPVDPNLGIVPGLPDLPGAATSFAPPDQLDPAKPLLPPPRVAQARLLLKAELIEGGKPLKSGLMWRVFGVKAAEDGRLPLVATAAGGDGDISLDPGVYLVHCSFGHASSTVRVEVGQGIKEESVILNAGGLKLQALAEDEPLPDADVRFDVYAMDVDTQGERMVVARDVEPGELVRLTAGTYHVVSRYGTINASTRADVEVKAGKLSEVTLYQRAAEVTLKLVGEPGGEAIADTHWSILTPGGDIVTEGVGAFPSFILAAGEYTVVAKHADSVFQRIFDVETGRDAEVEVLAENALPR